MNKNIPRRKLSIKVKPFDKASHFVPMHHSLFDIVMPKLSNRAWKLLCFIIRKTTGWNKTQDHIAYTQLMPGIGTTSWRVVRNAVLELLGEDEDGNRVGIAFITRDKGGSWDTAEYTINTQVEVSADLLAKNNGFVSKEGPGASRAVEKTVGGSTVERTVDSHRRMDGASHRRMDGDINKELKKEEERKENLNSGVGLGSGSILCQDSCAVKTPSIPCTEERTPKPLAPGEVLVRFPDNEMPKPVPVYFTADEMQEVRQMVEDKTEELEVRREFLFAEIMDEIELDYPEGREQEALRRVYEKYPRYDRAHLTFCAQRKFAFESGKYEAAKQAAKQAQASVSGVPGQPCAK